MSFFSSFKFTSKGPHSLGGQNGNNISIKYRDIHPSHLGYLDILVCGNSDPGTSGSLSPFCKMSSLYFDDSVEPSDFYYNLVQELKAKYKKKGVKYITFEYDNPEEFYKALVSFSKYADENTVVSGTSREGNYDIEISEEVDIDSEDAPSIVADAKKKKKSEKEALRKLEEQEELEMMQEENK